MTKRTTDDSVGVNEKGEKLYYVAKFAHLQVLTSTGSFLRIVKRPNGYCLQTNHYKSGNGECTEHQWIDIPIVDEDGKFIGYEMS